MKKNQEEKRSLNNTDPHINRGFQLMLDSQLKREEQNSKSFNFNIDRKFSILKKKIRFCLNISFDILK